MSAKLAVPIVILAGFHGIAVDALALNIASAAAAQVKATSVTDTLQTLDINKNGKVERSEIEAFARSQGMSAEDVMGDFKDLDTNGDGELSYSEIANVLGEADSQQQQQQPQQQSQEQRQQLQQQQAAKPQPVVAQTGTPALQNPIAFASKTGTNALKSAASAEATGAVSLQNLKQTAGVEAGKILATQFASAAQRLMAKSTADQNMAKTYEQEANALRGKAAALLEKATQQTKRAAAEKAAHVEEANKPKMDRMKAEAEQFKLKAGEQRALARKALEQASKAQSLMATLFKPLTAA